MKLIVGLGNPEAKYSHTRHNVGWRMLDAYAKEQGVAFQPKDKFKGLIAEATLGNEKVLLLKPTTYYNEGGEAARACADFYKIAPEDVLVIHDELALPLGTIRTRLDGSDAGNNGVKSVTQHLGPNTARVRIGVYSQLRDQIDDVNFVLGTFSREEDAALGELEVTVARIIDSFVAGSFHVTTHA